MPIQGTAEGVSDATREVFMIAFTVYGVVPSLKNQKRMARGRMYNDPQVMAYKRDFGLQVPPKYRDASLGSATRLLDVKIWLYHDSWRRDADAEIVFDCLQDAGVVSNDRWIRLKTINGLQIDKDRPRAHIVINELSLIEAVTGQPD